MAKIKLKGALGLISALIEFVPPIVRAIKEMKKPARDDDPQG